MESTYKPQDLAIPIQIRNAQTRLRENKTRLQTLVTEQLRRHMATQTGVFSSVRHIPTQSQNLVEHFLGVICGEQSPESSRQAMLEWARLGLSPEAAYAVMETLYEAGLDIGARQALRPALDAYRREFNTQYEHARHAETLTQHEQIQRGMYVTLQKQIQKERDARAALVRRQNQMEAAADLARVTSSLRDLNELLVAASRHLCERLELAFVGIYLLDEFKQWAILRAGAGEAGATVLAQGYQVNVRGEGVIGSSPLTRAFNENHPILLKEGVDPSQPYAQPLLPATPSAIVIPLNVRGTSLGFWTAHSDLPNAFTAQDTTVLTLVGDNLAYAIENADLFTRAQTSVRNMERAQRSYVRETWGNEPLHAEVVYSQQQDAFVPSGNGEKSEAPLQLAKGDAGNVSQGALSVPITLRGHVIGTVDLFDATQTRSWSENEKALASSVVEQMALALENARLFEQAQQRAQETAIINEMAVELSAQLDPARLFETVYRYLPRLMPAEAFIAWLYDADTGLVTRPALYDEGTSYPDEEAPRPPAGKMGRVLAENVSLRENLSVQEWEKENVKLELIIGGSKASASFLFVPLRVGARTLGVLSAQSYKFNAYNDHHTQVLASVASHAATALENARLFAETEQRAEETQQINEMARALSGELEANRLFETVYEYLPRLMLTDAFVVWYYDEKTHTITRPVLYDLGVHYPENLTPQPPTERLATVLKTNAPLVVNLSHAEYEHARTETHTIFGSSDPSASLLYVPLRLGDRIRGFLSVQSYQFNVYGAPQIALLTSVANYLATLLQNARLFDETRTRLKEMNILHSATQVFTQDLELDSLLQDVAQQFLLSLDMTTSALLRWDHEQNAMTMWFDYESNPAYYAYPGTVTPLAEDPGFMTFLQEGRSHAYRRDDPTLGPVMAREMDVFAWQTLVLAPLRIRDRVVGLVRLGDRERLRSFDENDMRFLESLANQASIALDNAELFDATSKRLNEVTILHSSMQILTRGLDAQTILKNTAEQLLSALEVHTSTILAFDRAAQELVLLYDLDPQLSLRESVGSRYALAESPDFETFLAQGKSQVFRLSDPNLSPPMRADMDRWQWKSLLLAPLFSQNQVSGIVELGDRTQERAFNADELRLAESLANQASIALENARLFDQTQSVLAETQLLYATGSRLNQVTSLEELVHIAAQPAFEQGAGSAQFLLMDYQGQDTAVAADVIVSLVSPGVRAPLSPYTHFPIEQFELGKRLLANPRELVLIEDIAASSALDEATRAVLLQSDDRALVLMPLSVEQRVLGAIAIGWAETHAFSAQEQRIYQALAGQLALVLNNRLLFEQTEHALAETQTLYEISARLNAANTIQEVLEAASGPAIVQGASRTALLRILVDELGNPQELEYNAAWPRNLEAPIPLGVRTLVGQSAFFAAIRDNPNEPYLLSDVAKDVKVDEQGRRMLALGGINAAALLPLKLGERWIGLLTFSWADARVFALQDARLYRAIMAQAATVLDNRALFEQTQVALEQTRDALNQVQEAQDRLNLQYQTANILARATSFEHAAGQLLENTCRSLNWQMGEYWTIDESTNRLVLSHLWNEEDKALSDFAADSYRLTFGPGEGLAGRTWLEARPIWISNIAEDPGFKQSREAQIAGLVSALAFPLSSETRQFGVTVFFSTHPQMMDETLRTTMIGVGSQIGQFLERRRAEEAVRQQNTYLTALHDTTLGLMRRLDLEELLQNIITRAAELVGTQHGYVHLVEPNGLELRMRVGVGLYQEFIGTRVKPGQGLAGTIWRNNEPIVVDDYRYYPERLPNVDRDVLRAVAGVPLRSGNQTVGVLGLASLEEGWRFGSAQIEALNRFAALAAVALDNAQLYNLSQDALTQTQRMAEREKTSAEIADKLYAASDVKAVLRTAAEELRKSTGSRRAVVRLNLGAKQASNKATAAEEDGNGHYSSLEVAQ